MNKLRITVDGRPYEVTVEIIEEATSGPSTPAVTPPAASAALASVSAPVSAHAAPVVAGADKDAVLAPLAGKVVSVDCKPGQQVEAGAQLLTLEAMKMNTFINAPSAGVVTSILVNAGDAVEDGQVLVTLK